jgi:hypothetical protein
MAVLGQFEADCRAMFIATQGRGRPTSCALRVPDDFRPAVRGTVRFHIVAPERDIVSVPSLLATRYEQDVVDRHRHNHANDERDGSQEQ